MPTTDVESVTTTDREEDEMWGLKTVVAKTGLSRSTLYAYVSIGLFPKQRRLGVRRIAWLASEVRVWMTSRPQ
ncbi:MAG: AlpA family phage regulatory protein [Hyphomicrobiaceae bacterium]